MRIVALGGSGHAGREIASLLAPSLTDTDELVLAGRDVDRLALARDAIPGPAQVHTVQVDVADFVAVRKLMVGADLAIVTVSRPDLIGELARIVLDEGADWFDTLLSTRAKLEALRSLAPQIEQAGRCFVTDGGFRPGLPAALVRWAESELDTIFEADVMAAMRIDWHAAALADSTMLELIDEFSSYDFTAWVGGERRRVRWAECPTANFGEPIGRKFCVPVPLAEMEHLHQDHPEIRRCGLYLAGFSPAMDYLTLPLLMTMSRVRPLRSMASRFARWSLDHLASRPPPHRVVVQLDAHGDRGGRLVTASVRVGGTDVYRLTAAPVVACLRRWLRDDRHPAGLHLQAHLLPVGQFLTDLTDLGLDVEAQVMPTP
jgi:saccharopine dehydrogenase-like NADP-dependent oxidoreductase